MNCKRRDRLVQFLRAHTSASVRSIGCRKVCKDPIAGLVVNGRMEWFSRLDRPKRVRALADLVAAPGRQDVPKAQEKDRKERRPAVVERVRLVGVSGPLEMLGVSTRYLPEPPGAFLGTPGFPPLTFPTKPLSEQNVVPVSEERTAEGLPERDMQLAIGVKVTAPGEAAFRSIEVSYRAGEKTYTENLRPALLPLRAEGAARRGG